MNKRGFAAFAVILIIVIVLVVAGGVWYYEAHRTSSVSPIAIATKPPSIPMAVSTINTSTWDTYDGIFSYPQTWSAINGADLGNFADAGFAPGGSPTSTVYIIVGSRGCRPDSSSVTSSVIISGGVWTRIDDPSQIVICRAASPNSDGPGGGTDFEFAFNSTTTKAIEEAVISTLNLNNY